MTTHDAEPQSWLERLLRRLIGRAGAGATARAKPAKLEWVLLESVHSAALGSLHQQVLNREGIPVMVREFGGGSAILGGVPVGVSIFVPQNRLREALAVLGLDPALGASDPAGEPGD